MGDLQSSKEGSSGGQDTGDNKSHFVKENGLRCHILEKKSRSLRSYRSQNFQALEEISPLGLSQM